MIELESIKEARGRIAPYIRNTPYLPFDYLSAKCGKEIFLKCESLQRVGSFKIRGAANCILQNLVQAKKGGVVAASAGNHAQGVAAIAKFLGIHATIIMPTVTPTIKVQNTQNWGADVHLIGQVYDEAYDYAMKLSAAKGYLFIHAFRDPLVIAGQGTVGLELMEEKYFADVQAVVVSVGGGGLSTGIASVLRKLRPDIKIYGVGARNAPATFKSFHQNVLVDEPVTYTLAEGVATKKTDTGMLAHLRDSLDDFFVLGEESIAHAISLLAEHGKMLVEGAGALPISAVLEGLIPEKKVALILSGGNIDIPALSQVLNRGLVEQGRQVRLVITISDRPGGLLSITQVIADQGGNILQVFHQRSTLHTRFGEAEVEVDLGTRSQEHTQEIIKTLMEKGFRVHRVS